MATFYPSSTNQRVVIGNSYFRDPSVHTLYPESAVSGNMAHLNYSSSGPYSEALAGCTDSQPNGFGFTDLVASHLGENGYNFWRDGRNEMLSMEANDGSRDGGGDHQMGLQPELGILSGHNLSFQQSKISNVQGRGLSLSLGMQIPVPTFKYQPAGSDVSIFSCYQSSPGNGGTSRDDNSRRKILNACVLPYELTGITSTIPNFKYLKPAQQLLDEVVNVHKALEQKAQSGNTFSSPACKDNNDGSKSDANPSNHQESTANSLSGLSQPVRQDLQSKTTKLLAMLDEIDRRYKQYYHQMQIVVSSFDATVGSGAAKPYTILALRTISRHFRCLRDAVGGQIQSTQKILGEQDGSRGKGCGISSLRYIDQKMRQQRAIQQLGVMPQHVWRPQRGLPENSVSILRAWLFEHFLHPYPNDSEKLMLARQTGLTRNQVSNWFINARVRLWKPMVEDMYKEEFGDNQMEPNSLSDNATKGRDESHYEAEEEPIPTIAKCETNHPSHPPKSNPAAGAPDFQNEPHGERPQDSASICLLHDAIRHAEGSSRFIVAYPMAELGRYGNGVSLTLGLQHCDGNLQASDGQERFLPVRGGDIYNAAPSLGFGPSQLLRDFVA